MSHVNGNDIDDLFRRASEKYPLKVGSGDWPHVAADLEKDPSLVLPPVGDEGDRRRRKRFLWLLLLLPLGGLGYLTYTGKGVQTTVAKGPNTRAIETTASTGGAAVPASGTTSTRNTATATGKTTALPINSATSTGGTTALPRNSATSTGGTTALPRNAATSTGGTTASTAGAPAAGSQTTISTEVTAAMKKGAASSSATGHRLSERHTKNNAGRATDGSTENVDGAVNGSVGKTAVADAQRGATATGGSTDASRGNRDPRYAGLLTQRAAVGGGIALDVKVQARPISNATVTGKNNLQKLSRKKQTSFYIGLLASPDLSTVKMQSIKGVGTTFSFLLGYNINRNWAIETGLSLDRKKYFTQGEYFSKEHLNLYPGYSLLNVDGVCNMWELPINVRYNFGQGNGKAGWFATAGMSTYFMSKENYSYQTENMATGAVGGFSHTFAHSTQYPFSVINLSMGYEQSLGKIGNLRLEPYLRVPLAGIGTGSLPIMSAGLNIGITRRIW